MAMIRKIVQLVRSTTRSESIAAVIELPNALDLETVEPSEVWWLLRSNGMVPECDEEVDDGIGAFIGDYHPQRHAHLPVVNLSSQTETATSCINHPASIIRINRSNSPEIPSNSNRICVELSADCEQYEVKRLILEAATLEAIESADASNLWYYHPKIEVQVDASVPNEVTLEWKPFELDQHPSSPVILWKGTESHSPETFLSNWQPISSADGKDHVESERVRNIVVAFPNSCYQNARAALRSLPQACCKRWIEPSGRSH